jgi:hypothetical protein
MAILCHRWWPLQESVFFALEGEPVLDAGHALYCSTYYSRAVSVARSHTTSKMKSAKTQHSTFLIHQPQSTLLQTLPPEDSERFYTK